MTRLIGLAMLALFALPAGSAVAKTIQVPKDHDTIQAAVDAASEGDRILVKGGNYSHVTIDHRSNLTITGKGNPVIGIGGIRVLSSLKVEVSGITVQTTIEHGVFIDESSEITIRKCKLRNISDDGIRVQRSGSVRIERNVIDDIGETGINLHWQIDHQVACVGVVIQKNTLTNIGSHGITVTGLGHEVVKNRVSDVATHCFVARDLSGDSTVSKNRFEDAGNEGMVIEGDNFTVSKNSITNTAGDGISIHGDRNLVEKNKVWNCGDDGIEVWEADGCVCEKNKVFDIEEMGFDVDNSTNGRYVRNKVSDCGDHGFRVAVTGTYFEKNRVKGVSDCGFFICAGGNDFVKNVVGKCDTFDFYEDCRPYPLPNHYEKNKYKTSNL